MIKGISLSIKILLLILVVWVIQILFLNQAAKWGMNGWDDWGWLYYFDFHKGGDLSNFSKIKEDTGTPYIWTEIYYIGPLKELFGLNQTSFKYVELLFKALAGLSAAFLIYKLTNDKLFTLLTIFFFIIFPSTAGVLSHNVLSGGYLSIVFMCFFVLFYFQSVRHSKKIYLASLFYYLALLACPPRAYLILPVPLLVELIRLRKSFRPYTFIGRLVIFYIVPLVTLQSRPGWFDPMRYFYMRIHQITSGNLYTLAFPFQAISTLFIDQSFIVEILELRKKMPFINSYLSGFLILDILLFVISVFLGFVIKKTGRVSFILWLSFLTLVLEILFHMFGLFSLDKAINTISFINLEGVSYLQQTLDPTIYQASFGGYIFILGLIIGLDWWKHQRSNKILMVITFAWMWTVGSEVLLYLTNSWWNMITESNDKYILACSLGAVIFFAGIITLCFNSFLKIKNVIIKLVSCLFFFILISIVTYKEYRYIDTFYFNWNEGEGGSVYWQDTMYQRFLDKFGKENFKKDVLLYVDPGSIKFNKGSFGYPITYRIFYDEKGNFIRGFCKEVIVDIKILQDSYVIINGERGFSFNGKCVDRNIPPSAFLPLDNFYAFKMENKNFIDIRSEIINQLDANKK